jgi:hypothetical protein
MAIRCLIGRERKGEACQNLSTFIYNKYFLRLNDSRDVDKVGMMVRNLSAVTNDTASSQSKVLSLKKCSILMR